MAHALSTVCPGWPGWLPAAAAQDPCAEARLVGCGGDSDS